MDKKAVQEHVVFLCFLVMAVHLVISSSLSSPSWWSLSVSSLSAPSAVPNSIDCSNSTFLASSSAQEVCAKDKNIILAVSRGAKAAIIQCQTEFGNLRWNCTTFLGQHLFGKFITTGTIESAAVYSFMSAGAAREVAGACRTGAISNCICETIGDVRTQDDQGNIIFNECSDNIKYASDIVRQLIKENSTNGNITDVELVNNHNYEVGLRILANRNASCVCHGVSGTCTVQTCYQQVPDVATFGEIIRWKYINAVKVSKVPGMTTLKPVYNQNSALNESELAFVTDTPDLCVANNNLGILGTSGRKCNPSSQGLDSCYFLCCGRGYTSKTTIVPQECCQFVWCCRIECTYCRNITMTDYYCN